MGVLVRQRPKDSGIWYLVINHQGHRKSKKVGANKKKAAEVANIVRANLLLGRPLLGKEDQPKVPTLKEYYRRFESTYMETAIKESSYIVDESAFRVHTLPQLGNLRLDQINGGHIEDFISVLMGKDLGKHSIKVVLGSLRLLLNNAIEKGLIKENPVSGAGKLYRQAPVRHEDIEPLSEEESLLLLQAASEWEAEHFPLFLCVLHTGLRGGEVIGLQWGDIDWSGKFMEIRRQVVRGKLTTLKTKHGRRRVDLSGDLLATFSALKTSRQEKALKGGSSEISKWVFANDQGDRMGIDYIKAKVFTRILSKAGLRKIRFHDLRHTYASQLLANGVPATYVSRQLGHSNPKITWGVYAHWAPGENQRQAVNQLPSLNRISGGLDQAKAQMGRN